MESNKNRSQWKRLLINLILWIVSIILKWIVGAVSIVINLIYYIVTFKKSGPEKLADYFYNRALSNDQHGNACYPRTFEVITKRNGGEPYGNPDDTISYVLARNKYKGKLHFGGRLLAGILEAIDPGHMYDSIENKKLADQDAILRHQEDKYYE